MSLGFFDRTAVPQGWFSESAQAKGWFHSDLLGVLAAVTGGLLKYWTGSAWVSKPVKYWNGSAWVAGVMKWWDGAAWQTSGP